MSLPTKTRQWTLASQPAGKATYGSSDSNFQLEEKDLPSLGDGQILIQLQYLSNDPAQRGWIARPSQIDPKRLYVPPVPVGERMRARGLCKVVASKSSEYKEGDMVRANIGWREYDVVDPKDKMLSVSKVDPLPGGLSVTHYLGALGSTGLTADYGLCEIGRAKKGDRVVVSGAAGAVGSMVVQIAKHIVEASYVVGIAGSDDKCRWVESLGADKCLNYKSKTFAKDLKEACGDGVDVYFDNVGGEALDFMLENMNRHGRIAACGAITGYNGEAPLPMKNWFNVISMRLEIKGFIVFDHKNPMEIIGNLVQALKDGKIKIGDENETVVDTKFEEIPKTWLMLFEGGNQGKLITKMSKSSKL